MVSGERCDFGADAGGSASAGGARRSDRPRRIQGIGIRLGSPGCAADDGQSRRRAARRAAAAQRSDRAARAGRPREAEVILNNLTNAHSLAFKDGWLYVATTPAIVRVRWVNGKPSGEPEKVADLPSSTPSLHVSRTINFGPDGRLYVSIGSSCNVCIEPDPRRTTIQVVNADGTLHTYARGLHNAIGF